MGEEEGIEAFLEAVNEIAKRVAVRRNEYELLLRRWKRRRRRSLGSNTPATGLIMTLIVFGGIK